jgi:hypothetical protein
MVKCYSIYSVNKLVTWLRVNYPAATCQTDPLKPQTVPGIFGNQMLESTKWQISQSLESANCLIFTMSHLARKMGFF